MALVNFFIRALLPTLAICSPTVSRNSPQTTSDAGPVLVTGRVPVRREIRDLEANFPDQWSLYLLGLRAFQLADETDPASYYSIAGIHGKPYTVWQNAVGINGSRANKNYCPHTNTMFLGWHRPYLALYEQELQRHIKVMANTYPANIRKRYTDAADQIRIPYWDWALGAKGGSVPTSFLTPTISVIAPDGNEHSIPNPLYTFAFHPVIPGAFNGEFAKYNTTLRWPDSNGTDARSQDQYFIQQFEGYRASLVDNISIGFMNATSMNQFSMNYLEPFHGYIHSIVGGGRNTDLGSWPGHMWPAEMSAYDPLFWLHHSNVDRLFNLWQAAHPDQYVEPANVGSTDTAWFKKNTMVDADTPLVPFWKTPDTFWTTNQARDTRVFGYAYPETQFWNYANDNEYRISVNTTIAQLYSPMPREMLTAQADGIAGSLNSLLVDRTYVDWSILVEGSRSELPSTFMAKFFLVGDFSSDVVTDVGIWTILMHESMGAESTEEESTEAEINEAKRLSKLEPKLAGSVSLTTSLLQQIKAGKLDSLHARDVVPYLTDKLTWKVEAGDGTALPHDHLGGLTVNIASTNVRIPDDPKQPMEYRDAWTFHPEVTLGKNGGMTA